MGKKKPFKILIIALVLFVIFKVLDNYAAKKVAFYLKSEGVSYDNLDISFLSGNLELTGVFYAKDSLTISAENISIEDLSYYKYFSKKEIHLNDFKISNAKIVGKLIENEVDTVQVDSTKNKELSLVNIDNISLENIEVAIEKKNNYPLKIKSLDVSLDDFELDLNSSKKIPFTVESITSEINHFETTLSEVQDFSIGKISITNNDLVIDSLFVKPTKTRKEYIYFVEKEQELLNLFTKKIKVSNFNIEEQDSLFLGVDEIVIDETNFDLYLDATVLQHSRKHKNLYSKSLRQLPLKLDVKTLQINNSRLVYEELTKKENKAGILVFNDLEASITNINNSYFKEEKMTVAEIKASFMKDSPLNIKWTFDINNKEDDFRLNGSLFNLKSEDMSSFLLPTMNVKVDGAIHKMYFDIEGNNYISNGKMQMDFEDLKLRILDQEKHKKKVISWLVNLFVKDESGRGLADADIKEVKRDQTKSFWNYFWLNIENGLKNSLI